MHVQQPRIRVDVHRQIDTRMPHGRLGDSRGNAGFAQVSSERMPQGVNIHRPAEPPEPLHNRRPVAARREAAERLTQFFVVTISVHRTISTGSRTG